MEWRGAPKLWLLLLRNRVKDDPAKNVGVPLLAVKPSLLPSLEWYLGQLQWLEDGRSHGVTFLELAIDFETATGVQLEMPRMDEATQLGKRARAFYAAASAVGRYVNRRPWPPGLASQPVNCLLNAWGFPRSAGLAWRPRLLHPDVVESFCRTAAQTIYATDADFFRQQVPQNQGGSPGGGCRCDLEQRGARNEPE